MKYQKPAGKSGGGGGGASSGGGGADAVDGGDGGEGDEGDEDEDDEDIPEGKIVKGVSVCVRVRMYVCLTASVWLCVELTMRGSKIGEKSGRFVSIHVCIYYVYTCMCPSICLRTRGIVVCMSE